jgi:hypothetical protein
MLNPRSTAWVVRGQRAMLRLASSAKVRMAWRKALGSAAECQDGVWSRRVICRRAFHKHVCVVDELSRSFPVISAGHAQTARPCLQAAPKAPDTETFLPSRCVSMLAHLEGEDRAIFVGTHQALDKIRRMVLARQEAAAACAGDRAARQQRPVADLHQE